MGLLHFARRNAGAVVLEVGDGRPARLDERRPSRALGRHDDLVRPHPAARHDSGGDRHREGGHLQTRSARLSAASSEPEAREAIRRVASSDGAPLRETRLSTFDYRFEPPAAPLTRPDRGPGDRRTLANPLGRIDAPAAREPTRPATPRWPWRVSTSWPSGAGTSAATRWFAASPRSAGLPRVEVLGEVALAGRRQLAQRRVRRGAGGDPATPVSPPRRGP